MHSFVLIFAFISLVWMEVYSQKAAATYKTKFEPALVTYNASDNPNQCWEAVEHGIRIKADKGKLFFEMPHLRISGLKEKIKDAEVVVEVVFYSKEELQGRKGEARGFVRKIVMGEETIY